MENKSNKDAIIIILLVVLLLATVVGLLWYSLSQNNTNKVEIPQNSSEQALIAKDAEIQSLRNELTSKNTEITSLKGEVEAKEKEIQELNKKVEGTTSQTGTNNKSVLFDAKKVKHKGEYVSGNVKLAEIRYILDCDPTGVAVYCSMLINSNGEVEVDYEEKKYKVKGFSKKVVELYVGDDGQSALESGIAVMEDGTIEQIYFDGNNFKTRGTIGGVKNVVKLIYIREDGYKLTAAVQADGDIIVLSGLKNYYNPGA